MCNAGRWNRFVVGALGLCFAVGCSWAGIVQDVDPSIRSAGMGGANAGVYWGAPTTWGNIASLANVQGVRWVYGSTRTLPEISKEFVFRTQELELGAHGIGILLAGKPVEDLGFTQFDLGPVFTDPFGGSFGPHAKDQIDSWGIAVAPFELMSALRPGRERQWGGRASISLGFRRNHEWTGTGRDDAFRTNSWTDFGLQGGLELSPREAATRWALGIGCSQLGKLIPPSGGPFIDLNAPERIQRVGAAMQVVRRLTPEPRPFQSWPFAAERAIRGTLAVDYDHRIQSEFRVPRDRLLIGAEATLFDVLSARLGYAHDPDAGFKPLTYGAGVRVPLTRFAALTGDWASWPAAEGSDIKNRNRYGLTVELDPLAFLTRRDAGTAAP